MNLFRDLAAAFQFLTAIPLPIKTGMKNLQNALPYFPLVGATIGLLAGLVFLGGSYIFPQEPATVIGITAYILVSRGLHLDGFMDTIDGFFSRRDRKKILEILKESTTGSFAILGAGIWFLVLYSTIPKLSIPHMVAGHCVSRFSLLLLPLFFSYPRESGTGKFFVENGGIRVFLVGLGFTLACILPFGVHFLVLPALTLITTYLTGLWSRKMIGGITGDVLGFSVELNNMLVFLVLANKVIAI